MVRHNGTRKSATKVINHLRKEYTAPQTVRELVSLESWHRIAQPCVGGGNCGGGGDAT